jgi:beta-lactam-binding protein with PASTA domain
MTANLIQGDELDPTVGEKRARVCWMLARLVAVAVFFICAGLVFWQSFVHTVHRGTLAVPNLVGEGPDIAAQTAHDLGVQIMIDGPGVFTSMTPPGSIAQQDPPPGFHVKVGSTVKVRLSLGGERIRIPNVHGESLHGGLRALEQVGVEPGRRSQLDGQATGDRIIATDPAVDSEIAPDTAVDLLVNVSPATTVWVMPSLLSHPLEEVRPFCRGHQLRLGQVHEVEYPGLVKGLVLRQYPPAGSPVSRNDIITVWVSK